MAISTATTDRAWTTTARSAGIGCTGTTPGANLINEKKYTKYKKYAFHHSICFSP
jgi:hypothetical protein